MEESHLEFEIEIIKRRKIKAVDFDDAYFQASLWALDEKASGYGASRILDEGLLESRGMEGRREPIRPGPGLVPS